MSGAIVVKIATLSVSLEISASASDFLAITSVIESTFAENLPEIASLTFLEDIGPSLLEHLNTELTDLTLARSVETSSASG